MGLLDGKNILITGAGGRLGCAAVMLFSEQGANVIATAGGGDERQVALDAVGRAGPSATFIEADLLNDASVASLFEDVKQKVGRLDGAFNAAGFQADPCNITDVAVEEFDRSINANLRYTFLCLQHELRLMEGQGSGAVVNAATIAGLDGFGSSVVDNASNFGITGMSRVAALDMAPFGIRVNALCAGAFASEEERAEHDGIGGIPMKRVADVKEIVGMAMVLLSDLASYVTGQSIAVDGGVTTGITAV